MPANLLGPLLGPRAGEPSTVRTVVEPWKQGDHERFTHTTCGRFRSDVLLEVILRLSMVRYECLE